jgi:hypothetical protein
VSFLIQNYFSFKKKKIRIISFFKGKIIGNFSTKPSDYWRRHSLSRFSGENTKGNIKNSNLKTQFYHGDTEGTEIFLIKLRASLCSPCLRVFLQNHPKKEPKMTQFPPIKKPKKPVSYSHKGVSS